MSQYHPASNEGEPVPRAPSSELTWAPPAGEGPLGSSGESERAPREAERGPRENEWGAKETWGAIRPDSGSGDPVPGAHVPESGLARRDLDGALAELPGLLARSTSGMQFIYQALEVVAARYGLRDLLVAVPQPERPQIFRLRRAVLHLGQQPAPQYLQAALSGHPGVYADPPVVGPLAAASLTSLVELALRLDVLGHDASHDSLTGILNRRSYELLLDQAVSRARRYGWPFALVLLDLDDFKVVNDRYGHAAGDAALRAVGAELRAALRSGDVAARLGGDEFALLVVGVDNASSLSPILSRLKRALERAVPQTTVGFSVGVACFPSDTEDPNSLMGLADERLYAAKAAIG
ncbi:MAG TPA: GGDEF domain-containing protein [Acidimicrobiales bacterium]|nr:GGDEF domain-containing protein [Acidimicrobiales bacterium]